MPIWNQIHIFEFGVKRTLVWNFVRNFGVVDFKKTKRAVVFLRQDNGVISVVLSIVWKRRRILFILSWMVLPFFLDNFIHYITFGRLNFLHLNIFLNFSCSFFLFIFRFFVLYFNVRAGFWILTKRCDIWQFAGNFQHAITSVYWLKWIAAISSQSSGTPTTSASRNIIGRTQILGHWIVQKTFFWRHDSWYSTHCLIHWGSCICGIFKGTGFKLGEFWTLVTENRPISLVWNVQISLILI